MLYSVLVEEPIRQASKAPLAFETNQCDTALSLLMESITALPSQSNNDIFEIFSQNPQVIGLPVVEDERPVGLINRHLFMDNFARPFHREIYGKKSCIAYMDKEPLIVDSGVSIEDLGFRAVEAGRKALADGFIITRNGYYIGMGTGEGLVQAITHLQAEKNRLVMESIGYASVIQKSFLRPSRDNMAAILEDYFIYWEPRDVVGGDYYFFTRFEDGFFAAVIDCTGHGVPGAFMTLIISAFLDHESTHEHRKDPAYMLSSLNLRIKRALSQSREVTYRDQRDPVRDDADMQSDDGLDAALCWVDFNTHTLTFAGARTPLFYLLPGDAAVSMLEGDRKGAGYTDTPADYSWTNKTIPAVKDMRVYITTDGLIDQIGGEKHIAFGKRRFKQWILDHHREPIRRQQGVLAETLRAYQGDQIRRDDMTVFGFRL